MKASDKIKENSVNKEVLEKRNLEKENEIENTTEPSILSEPTTSTTTSTTTTKQITTTTNKYQKLAEYYKNKYAGKYLIKQ